MLHSGSACIHSVQQLVNLDLHNDLPVGGRYTFMTTGFMSVRGINQVKHSRLDLYSAALTG